MCQQASSWIDPIPPFQGYDEMKPSISTANAVFMLITFFHNLASFNLQMIRTWKDCVLDLMNACSLSLSLYLKSISTSIAKVEKHVRQLFQLNICVWCPLLWHFCAQREKCLFFGLIFPSRTSGWLPFAPVPWLLLSVQIQPSSSSGKKCCQLSIRSIR